MTDEEIETAYEAAFNEYMERGSIGASSSRYFFFAGAQFGTKVTAELYSNGNYWKQFECETAKEPEVVDA